MPEADVERVLHALGRLSLGGKYVLPRDVARQASWIGRSFSEGACLRALRQLHREGKVERQRKWDTPYRYRTTR